MQVKCSNNPLLQVEKLGCAGQSHPSGGWGRDKVESRFEGAFLELWEPGSSVLLGGLCLEGFAATLWNY